MANLSWLDVLHLVEQAESLVMACEFVMTPKDRQRLTPDVHTTDEILERVKVLTARVRGQM